MCFMSNVDLNKYSKEVLIEYIRETMFVDTFRLDRVKLDIEFNKHTKRRDELIEEKWSAREEFINAKDSKKRLEALVKLEKLEKECKRLDRKIDKLLNI